MNSLNDFDLGPLTWVKGEIDVACNAGIAALQAWNGEDLTPLKQALTYLHQVSGAIQIVGLQGVYQLGSAIEGLLADMQSRADLRNADSAALAVRAVQALQGYLDNLMAGAANAELALMPIYGEVQIRRGAEAPPPSELFYPDTGLRARRPGGEPAFDDGERGRAMRQVRSKYQKGLLRYLQNQDAAAGLAAMAEAVRELQALVPGAAQYTFWWTAEAMLEALAADGAAPDAWLKRLLGRLDLQMRRLAEGARQLADSLFRDVLYCLLRTPGGGERADAVRELFELERYRPAAWSGVDEQRAEALRPMLGRLREVLNAAKDHWLHLCSGRKDSLDPLRASVAQIGDSAGRIGDPALSTLADAIRQVIAGHADEAAQNEALQVEMATAMLLLQHGAENYFKLGQDFGSHAEVQAGRLRAAVSGEAPLVAAPGEPLLDEIARQAQEKLLLAQVTREIQSNLNQIEEILDKFFRNQQDRGSLPLVPSLLKQVQGALSILQLEPAVELVRVVTDRVGLISEADHAIVPDELNWIAEAVSTLGLYVEALRNGRDDPAGLIRLLHPEAEAEPAETSVEEHLAALKEGLVATVDRLAEGGEADTLRGELRADLQRIAQDADLVGDAALRGQADEVRRLLDDNAATDTVRVATHALAGVPLPAPVIPEAPAAPAPASTQEVDSELLEIYLEEAKEVLAGMAERLARLRESTQAHDDFVDIRRGFHTLKGSGRMVGLTDLAEVAWEAEQTLNLWLRDERAINVAILDFVDQAATGFRRWVGELAETGAIGRLDADAVVALARRLRGEEVEAPAAPAAPPAMPEAPVAALAAVAPPEPEIVQIGRHSLSAALFAIFSDEATRRLADLRQHLADLAVVADEHVWAEFARAAHTLAGIARTTGLTPLADAAYALETWIGAWPDKQRPLAAEPEGVLSGVVDLLGNGLEQIARHEWPSFPDDLAERLTGLSPAPAESATGAAEEELFAALLAEPELPEAGSEPTPEPVPEPVPEPLVAPEWPAEAPLEIPFQPALEPVSEPPFEPLPEAVPPAPEPPVPEPWVPVPAPEFPVEPVPVEFVPETVPEFQPEFQPEGMPASFAPVAELAPPVAPEVPVEPAPAIAAEPPEECDPQLLPIFLAEAEELLPRIGDSLRRWRAAPTDAEPCQALQRTLHTLKGSARMAGAMRLGDATHAMETRIVDLGTLAPEAAFLDSLEHDYDALAERVDRLRQPAPVAAVAPAVGIAAPEAAPVAVPLAPTAEDDNALRQAFRANANILDALINEAGEVSIARSRIEDLVTHYKLTAQELTANVERLRGQLRELEIEAETQIGARMSKLDESHFDPLEFDRYTRLQELTRLMAESVNDVSTAQENLLGSLNDVEYALLQQSRTTRSLQQELMHIRMVRLNSQAERLHRIVRQAAKEVGRRAHLLIEGGDIELDRSVLDKAMAPFEHLLRNAVAHGIEAAERRQALGKPEYGDIRLTARQDGTEVVLTLSDDGGGIDLDKVRARAEAMGWVTPDDSVERERLESFLFMPGFSTMETVTQVAGRGVGLDVVRSEIASVGGRIRLDSEVGRGTRFTIRLPTTLALTQVVLARAGDQVYAFPAGMVVLVREVREADWHAIVSASGVELDGQNYPLRSLAELTGQQPQPAEGHYRTVLLLRSGDERVAMRVDKLQGNVEAVVKAIGPQLSRVPGVAGATVLPDGRVALILNPFALMESAPGQALSVVEGVRTEAVQPLVLVVDDSLTVRKITGRLLHREGYRVATAKDGVEALEYLQGEVPAVMLLDIEMPRMDGFEVARHVRADVRTRGVPIVMITSRTADKHRDHALDLGVNLYMGKPYQEEELLAAIAGFVAGQG